MIRFKDRSNGLESEVECPIGGDVTTYHTGEPLDSNGSRLNVRVVLDEYRGFESRPPRQVKGPAEFRLGLLSASSCEGRS